MNLYVFRYYVYVGKEYPGTCFGIGVGFLLGLAKMDFLVSGGL